MKRLKSAALEPEVVRTNLSPEAERLLSNLYAFLDRKERGGIWGLDLCEQPHREIIEAIQEAELNDANPSVMVIVPRGTYKTSIARGAIVWKLLRQIYLFDNPYHRIAMGSATLRLGRETLSVISNQLRYNKELIAAFGELWMARGSKTEDGIVLKPRLDRGEIASCPEPNLWIASERKVSTGAHCDELYVDDLHDEKSVQTQDRIEKVHNVWRLLQPLLNPTDRVGRPARRTVTATRWHDNDVPGLIKRTMEENRKSDWVIIQRGAFTEVGAEEGPLYFPSVLSEAILEDRKRDLGPGLFSANYLNDPVGKNGFIPEEWIQFAPRASFPSLKWMRITLDPNSHNAAKRMGDWAAITVSGSDKFGKLYVVDLLGSRTWGPTELLDALFGLNEEYEDVPFYIEDEHATFLEKAILMEEDLRSSKAGKRVKLKIHWVGATRNETKYERWSKLYPRFSRR